jgi:zinc protease
MKQSIAVIALSIACVACGPSAPGGDAEINTSEDEMTRIFDMPYLMRDLDNGLRVIVVRTDYPDIVTLQIPVQTGSRNEVEPGKSGFAHFFEHMMFRGTEKYPDYDAATSSIGAAPNAFTSTDMTVYHLVASNEYLATLMDLESDRFQNLRYSEGDFRTEAGAILGEYQQGALSPPRWLNEKVRETAFLEHTYRHTTIGFEADIRAMPEGYDYSRTFYERFYRPENVVLVVAGDFDRAEARRLIEQHYAGWTPGYVPPAITPEPPQTEARERTVQYPGRTLPILSINYKGPAWTATDTVAVAAELLGRLAFGPNSELYRQLVLQQRRVNALTASFGLGRDPGLLSITATVNDAADVDAVESEIYATVRRFHDELTDPDQLEAVKSNMKYGFLMGLETAQDVAFATIPFVINTGRVESIEDYFRSLDAVTPEHVRRAARQFLVDTGRTTITMVQAEG